MLELVLEVLVSCCIRRRDDSDASNKSRQGEQLLCIQQSVRFELRDRLLALPRDVTKRIGGVDPHDRET